MLAVLPLALAVRMNPLYGTSPSSAKYIRPPTPVAETPTVPPPSDEKLRRLQPMGPATTWKVSGYALRNGANGVVVPTRTDVAPPAPPPAPPPAFWRRKPERPNNPPPAPVYLRKVEEEAGGGVAQYILPLVCGNLAYFGTLAVAETAPSRRAAKTAATQAAAATMAAAAAAASTAGTAASAALAATLAAIAAVGTSGAAATAAAGAAAAGAASSKASAGTVALQKLSLPMVARPVGSKAKKTASAVGRAALTTPSYAARKAGGAARKAAGAARAAGSRAAERAEAALRERSLALPMVAAAPVGAVRAVRKPVFKETFFVRS